MTVTVAAKAGFCYGVKRAVEIAEREAPGGCWTLGELIHNRRETARLESLGVKKADCVDDIPDGATVVIRSHGEPDSVYERLREKGCRIADATCPNVERIHKIVRGASSRGRRVIILGAAEHPEVRGICGCCSDALVFRNLEEIHEWIKIHPSEYEIPVTIVFQTTEIRERLKKSADLLKKEYTNHELFDTICEATSSRQKEAEKLAAACDAMIVVGDRSSANSLRLAEICEDTCRKVVFAETASEIDLSELDDVITLGVTAGASTPAWIIKEVCSRMSEEINAEVKIEETAAEQPAVETAAAEAPAEIAAEAPAAAPAAEETFDEMLEKSIKTLTTGEKVTGIVESINATEITVDLGTKHSGYIPFSELSDDPDLKPEDIVKVGDQIETYVMRVSDVEGTVMLSKKRLDTVKNWDFIEQARENRDVLEGTVTEENKGGVVVNIKGIRVFVPASQTGLPKDAPMSELLKQKVKLRVTEVNKARRRVVGSIRAVQYETRRAAAEKTWEEIEEGKKYNGVVKSLTSYGAFVDIGGVDGMVHVSELSWKRIKNPAEVLKVGDEIEVYVISFDREKKKISLGYRKPEDNPWVKFTSSFELGSVATVKIVKLMPFGAFAEIVPGVDGLIHVSQITNERRIGKPDEVLSEGQTVEAKITNIDNENKKVSLSIRALMEPEAAAPAEPQEADDGADEVVYDTEHPTDFKTEEE
ncbi:MAG: bifunctional 4-hydroxy-3-methylbut-2-enyl diphosphate reductase/30S ribosomal protein S1 [Oscillospiraceae bacterium]|jgi:4-hydroxy-3-methylbut-2-enyl diphosphate reductase|nr:bifunctional 4-hydroxy-3-methylbut-2-enyl diphosphate reductase/30S ribosomal protein S1 [Oscillospiraceae bacterium]